MPARLSVFFPDRPVRRLVLADGESCLIGRGEGCDLALDDARVSRRHARLAPVAGGWRIEDLGSKNGTLVDGAPPPAEALPDFAWLSLGGVPARFERLSETDRRAVAERDRDRWQTSVLIQRRIDPAEGLAAVLDRTLASMLELCEAERAGVVLAAAGGGLEVAAAAGAAEGQGAESLAAERLAAEVFGGSRGAVERALATGRPVTLSDARSDTGLGGRASIVAGGIRALVCLPLRVLGRSIGALYADSRQPGSAFTELDVEILEALAGHAALAIGVARIQDEVSGLRGELPTRLAPAASPAAAADAGDPLAAAWERSLPAWRPPAGSQPAAAAAAEKAAEKAGEKEGEQDGEKAAGEEGITRAVPGRAAGLR